MIKDLAEGVAGLIVKTWGNTGLFGLIALFIATLYIAGQGAGWWNGNQKDRISMLQDLHQLAKDGIRTDPILAPMYEEIVWDIRGGKSVKPTVATPVGRIEWETIYKFIGGASIWLLILAISAFTPDFKRPSKRRQIIAATIFLMILTGIVSAIIPSFGIVWINYLLFPVMGVVILIYAGVKQLKKNTP